MSLALLLNPVVLIVLALASYRITRLLIQDEILSPIRDKIWNKWPPETNKITYLLTCYWCLGAWISAIVTVLVLYCGMIALVVAIIFALSAVVGIIQTLLDK